jgi:hypothetical protein
MSRSARGSRDRIIARAGVIAVVGNGTTDGRVVVEAMSCGFTAHPARDALAVAPRVAAVLELLPDGRVLVTLPAMALPFGCAMQATVVYRNLHEALCGARKRP